MGKAYRAIPSIAELPEKAGITLPQAGVKALYAALAAAWLGSAAAFGAVADSLYQFSGPDGGRPQGGLVQAADGNFYGTSSFGGGCGEGTVFRLAPGGSPTTLVTFCGTNGAYPAANLIEGADGKLYGTAFDSVFSVTTNGELTTLAWLDETTGFSSLGNLVQGADGTLYGTANAGGPNDYGTVFRLDTPGGALTVLAAFNGTNGAYPQGGLVLAPDGSLCGTTTYGGTNELGTVFRVSTNGDLTSLVSFGDALGYNAYSGLRRGADGYFYGTTEDGGPAFGGTVFRVNSNGGFTNLLTFGSGVMPSDVLRTEDGTLYVVEAGSSVLYGFTTNGSEVPLLDFAGTNGASPAGPLLLAGDGNLYGTTASGGAYGDGTIYRVAFGPLPPELRVLSQPGSLTAPIGGSASFSVGASSSLPLSYSWYRNGSPIPGATQSSYVITNLQVPDSGTRFSCLVSNALGAVLSSNAVVTILGPADSGAIHSFEVLGGGAPFSGLVLAADGRFYGTSARGGVYGLGSVFRTGPDGVFETLISFDGTGGSYPQGGLVQGRDGNLYGTTSSGADTLFRVTTNGTLTTIATFPNGMAISGGVIEGTDGSFYGTTASGQGTVFMVTTNGVVTTVAYFTGDNGALPNAPLVQGRDGNFYGTTFWGGANGQGTIFRMTPEGILTALASFSGGGGFSGGGTQAGLVEGDDGSFYGTTPSGGTNAVPAGTVFRVTTNGTFATLVSFSFLNGDSPVATLIRGADGYLYGSTEGGGPSSWGTVFRVDTNGNLRTLCRFSGPDGAAPKTSLMQDRDGTLYGITSSGGLGFDGYLDSGGGTVFRVVPSGPPANDTCGGAFVISSSPYTTNELTLLATSEGDPLPTCTSSPANGVWFSYTAPADGLLMVDTLGSDFPTALAVYVGNCGGLSEVACGDDSVGAWNSAIATPVAAGTTSYIQAGGYDGATGGLTLHLYLVEPLVITGVRPAGGDLVITASAGVSGWSYHLLMSTNLSLPLAQWMPISTNTLPANGGFTLVASNAVSSADAHLFFAIRGQPSN